MKSKKNNNNNIEISETQIEEKQFVEEPKEPPKEEAVKQKRVLSESQLEFRSTSKSKNKSTRTETRIKGIKF